MEVVQFKAEERPAVGKKAARKNRREGLVPCVMYGGDEIKHFCAVYNDLKDLIYTPDFKVAEATVNGETYRCIVKDVQFHPVTESILHVDFLHLIEGRPVKVDVPLRFKGTAPGVKAGGKLIQSVRRVRLKTTPDKLVNELRLDISNLQLDHSIRIRDIELTEGMEIVNPPSVPVARVETPRAMKSAATAAAAAEGLEATEGEGEEGEE